MFLEYKAELTFQANELTSEFGDKYFVVFREGEGSVGTGGGIKTLVLRILA